MPRPSTTIPQRIGAIQRDATALPRLIADAEKAAGLYGATDTRTLAAWASVEKAGATIHRQARLLAGKSKGG